MRAKHTHAHARATTRAGARQRGRAHTSHCLLPSDPVTSLPPLTTMQRRNSSLSAHPRTTRTAPHVPAAHTRIVPSRDMLYTRSPSTATL